MNVSLEDSEMSVDALWFLSLMLKKRIMWSHKLGPLNWAGTSVGDAPVALGPRMGLCGCLCTGPVGKTGAGPGCVGLAPSGKLSST